MQKSDIEAPSGAIYREELRVQRHKLVFSFGQKHSQWLVTGGHHLIKEPAFRSTVEAFDQAFYAITGGWLFARADDNSCTWCISRSNHPAVAHLTLQVALAALWQSWGILPDALLGEGESELAAAYVAGALTIPDAIQLSLELSTPSEQVELPALSSLQLKPTTMPVYSSQVGLLNQGQQLHITHWNRSLKKADTAVSTIDLLFREQYDVFVELGPPSTLSGAILARQLHLEQPVVLLPTLYQEKEISTTLQETLGTLSTLGYTVKWSALNQEQSAQIKPEWLNVAPTTELECKIAAVWQETLPSAQIGIHDTFFDLGGNSILMVKAYTKLYQQLGRKLSLVEMFFKYPTISALTRYLTEDAQHEEDSKEHS